MKNIIISLLLLLLLDPLFAQSLSGSLITSHNSTDITTGMNPITHELLPGSDWDIKVSSINKGNCSEYSTGDNIFNDGLNSYTDVQYVSTTNATCSGLSVPGDTNGLATFVNLGMVQETFFNSETITCSLSSSCDVTLNADIQSQKFANFNPTNGENGTSSGKINLFLYNFKTLSFTNTDGQGGVGGTANLPTPTTNTKYCVYKRDLASDGNSSVYAKTPEINIKKIFWTPYTQGPNGANGTSASSSSNKSYIIKGLDHSQLYWLGQDNIIDFGM